MNDRECMARALELAARGRTSPNPMVGAVLVRDGKIAGEGFHPKAGEPHAEIFALRQAGHNAQDATLYVTLEPCCHFGRTPPCTDALIAAGVGRVHMAMADPNPLVCGKGRRLLEEAGIETSVGLCEEEARRLNEVFVRWITSGRPFVHAKFAMSLDGRTAAKSGNARWISGETSREWVHRLRDRIDAICVGVETVIADDPSLTTRLPKDDVRHPLRVILDSRGRTPLGARILSPDTPGRTLIAATERISQDRRQALIDAGAEVWTLPERNGRVHLPSLLDELGKRRISGILVEGGGAVLGSFFDQRLVDRVTAFVAPMVLGGDGARAVGGDGVEKPADALRLRDLEVRESGGDWMFTGIAEQGESFQKP